MTPAIKLKMKSNILVSLYNIQKINQNEYLYFFPLITYTNSMNTSLPTTGTNEKRLSDKHPIIHKSVRDLFKRYADVENHGQSPIPINGMLNIHL